MCCTFEACVHPSLYSSQFVYALVMCWHFKSVHIVSLPCILGFCDVFVILSLSEYVGFCKHVLPL